MSKRTRRIILTLIILIIATVLTVFIIKESSGNPTIDSPGFNTPEITEDPNIATVTFPEGYTVTEIAEKLEENSVCSAEDFLYAVNNPSDELLEKLGIDNRYERIFTLEGYVFPDTYEFYKGESASSVLSRFTDNYLSKITESDKQRAAELGYDMDEILTIASIIQEEA